MKLKTKMQKVIKGTGGYVNMWNLIQKISGFTFINPKHTSLEIWKGYGITCHK